MRLLRQLRWHGSSRTLRRARRYSLRLEQLEPRNLLSGNPPSAVDYHETIDDPLDLGVLAPGTPLLETGNIGAGPAGAADVNFYHFNLAQPANVTLNAIDPLSSDTLGFVISLYNTDDQDPMGNRLIDQADGAARAGDASINIKLAAGDYYVGISSSGNDYYYPYLADSGYNGNTGNYQYSISASAIIINPGDGPMVLRFDPNETTYLPSGPLVLRASLSGPIDPNTLQAGSTVELSYDPTDPFTSSSGTPVALSSVNYDSSSLEIQATPAAPLAPGYYQFTLLGNTDVNAQVIETADATPIPLGEINGVNDGQDFSTTFYVAGILGNVSSNPTAADTLATARELGNVTDAGLVQVQGVIGDNPLDPTPFNPASVDFYHFEVTGSGNYALGAEVFANRIDSQLGAEVDLYQMQPDGTLVEIASNLGSMNATEADNGQVPLYSDPVIYASVTAGSYYIAVTSQFTTYDPTVTLSAQGGFTSGPYVLNLRVDPATTPPQVLNTSIAEGSTLTNVPTTLRVQFSEPMNLQEQAFQAYLNTFVGTTSSVYVQGADGTQYYPQFQSFDPTTNTATFLFIDALPNGIYTLHLSGPNGLTDLGGNPLVGNDPSGDYVVHFTVAAPLRGTPGDPTTWLAQEPNDAFQNPQQLGTLFPVELSNTVTISHPTGSGPSDLGDAADYYEINVLQTQDYLFLLSNLTNLPADVAPAIWADGVQQATIPQGSNGALTYLTPGIYVIGVDWSAAPATNVGYDLQISILGSFEPATALTTGPAPALRLSLATNPPPPAPSQPPSVLTNTPPTDPSPPSPPAPASPPPAAPVTNIGPTIPASPPPSLPVDNGQPPAYVASFIGPAVVTVVVAPDAAFAGYQFPQATVATATAGTAAKISTVQSDAAESSAGANAPGTASLLAPANGPAYISMPWNVVFALTDRALGAPSDPSSSAKAMLRETPANTALTATPGETIGPLSVASLVSTANTTAEETDALAVPPLAGSTSTVITLGSGIAQLEKALLQAAVDTVKDFRYYGEAVAQLFDVWQFGQQKAPTGAFRGHATTVAALPPQNSGAEQSLDQVFVSLTETGELSEFRSADSGKLCYWGIFVLSAMLVALRFQSWRNSRAKTVA